MSMDKYAKRNNLKKLYSIRENDEETGAKIYLGVTHRQDDDGWRWDLVASNGDDVTAGGWMSQKQATETISLRWGDWQTFTTV